MKINKISNKVKDNQNELDDEETMNINESAKKSSNKDDYINLYMKKTHLECIFFFIFIILMLFLIISGLFEKNHDEDIEQLGPVKYKNFINVAYAFDTNYHYITHVSMKSIMLSQNRDTFIIFHILVSSTLKNEEKEVIDKICQIHKNCEIKYFQIGERYKEMNTKGYIQWSTAMFFRLRLPELLPNEKRVLYLDCDTLIYKDLAKLYNYNIEGKYFIGMLEPRDLSYLGKNVENYINTGVMLFNLEELRNGKVAEKIEKFLIKYNYKLLFPVNDSVNVVCHEKNGYFPPEYVQWGFCNVHLVDKYIKDLQIKLNKNEVLQAYKDPYIYHLIGYKYKPWNGIPNYFGTVCIDPIVRFYQIAKQTEYYYEIIEYFKIHKDYLINQ
jgi:lipopolysaccharide biosynthesis glycosyltransferase